LVLGVMDHVSTCSNPCLSRGVLYHRICNTPLIKGEGSSLVGSTFMCCIFCWIRDAK